MKSFQNSRLILLLQSGSLVFLSVLLGILLMKSLWFCSLFTFFVILLFILHIDKQQQKLTEMVMRLITAIRFSDFSLSFRPGSKKQADPRLTQAMEQALKQFREKMYTLEEQHLYYNKFISSNMDNKCPYIYELFPINTILLKLHKNVSLFYLWSNSVS